MKKARPIGIANRAQSSSGSSKSSSQTVRVPGRAQLGVAAAQAPAALAGAEDPALDQMEEVAVVGVEPLAAQVAALARRRRRVAGAGGRSAAGPAGAGSRPARPGAGPRRAASSDSLMRPAPPCARPPPVEQRHRLELQAVVVERAPGARQVVAALAGRAGEHALAQLAVGERLAAAGAGVAVGEQAALDPGHDQLDAADLRRRSARPPRARRRPSRSNQTARRRGPRPGATCDHRQLRRPVADRRPGLDAPSTTAPRGRAPPRRAPA